MEEALRNAVGAVDGALTSVFTFAVYAASLHAETFESFKVVLLTAATKRSRVAAQLRL